MRTRHEVPKNPEAEKSVTACCMLQPRCIDDVLMVIKPEMICEAPTRQVFETIVEMYTAGKAIDVVTLARCLQKKKALEEVGGVKFLNELMDTVPHVAHAEHYAAIVRDEWIRRSSLEAVEAMEAAMRDPSVAPAEALASADQKLIQLVESHQSGHNASHIGDILLDLQALWESPESRTGVPTHISTLNQMTGGLQPGSLVIVAARPSEGKTALGLNFARHFGKHDTPVLVVSAEQDKLQISERLLAMEIKASIHDMQNGRVDALQFDVAVNELHGLPIYIYDKPSPNILDVESVARMYKRQKNIQALVVDYLQILEPAERFQVREQAIASMCRRMKGLARSLNIPVILMAQLNRQVESRTDRRPKLSDLRESGSVEQDADVIILIWRQHKDDPMATEEQKAEAVAIVAKNRQGPIGDVPLVYRKEYFEFVERSNIDASGIYEPASRDESSWLNANF